MMKLFAVLVFIMAVIAANAGDFPDDGPEGSIHANAGDFHNAGPEGSIHANAGDFHDAGPEGSIHANARDFPDDGPEGSIKRIQPLKKTAFAAVGDREVQEEHQNMNAISAEEIEFNYWNKAVKQRAHKESCVDDNGECMPKKTIFKKCLGKIHPNKKCNNKKDACCISEINHCVAEVELLKETINEGNENIISDNDMKMKALENKIDNLEDKTDMVTQQLNVIIASLNNSGCSTQVFTPTSTPASKPASTLTPTPSTSQSPADCPDGFFMVNGSSQCYIYLTDTSRDWIQASEKCISEGYTLAHPRNPIQLQSYIVATFGNFIYTWVNARGNGSQFIWQDNSEEISNNDSLWWPETPGSRLASSYCMVLLTHSSDMNYNPSLPYWTWECQGNPGRALCELTY